MSTTVAKTLCLFLVLGVGMVWATKEEPRFGVFSREDMQAIPLKHLEFRLKVVEGVMETEIEQRYQNEYNTSIDALYVFPVNYHSAVTNFTVWYSTDPNTELQAHLLPKEESQKLYEEATQRGHGGMYMSYDAKQYDVLSLSLGNILPNSTLKTTVKFVEQLRVEDVSWAIRIPTTFTPRYHPNTANTSMPDSARASVVDARYQPYTWSLNLQIDSSTPITRLISRSHNVTVELSADRRLALVTLNNRTEVPDRDIVILYRNQGIEQPHMVLQKSPLHDTYALLLSFLPYATTPLRVNPSSDLKTEGNVDRDPGRTYMGSRRYMEKKGEYVFVLDCSGSMAGGRIQQSVAAARLFLQSLPPQSFYNFLFFGTTYNLLYEKGSVAYTKENIADTMRYLDSVDANLGGTEIYAAMQRALELPTVPHYQRHILVMTDGEVTNTEAVIQLVEQNTREWLLSVHTIGIGEGASRHLVEGVARAGKGGSYFITEGEPIMSKVIQALSNMCADGLHEVTVEWPSDVTPLVYSHENFAYYNQALTILAIFPRKPTQPLLVQGLDGETKQTVTYRLSLEGIPVIKGTQIYQMAVKHAFNKRRITDPKVAEQFSLTYSVLCEYTAFVGIKLYLNPVDRNLTQSLRVPLVNVRDSFPLIQEKNGKHGTFKNSLRAMGLQGPLLYIGQAATLREVATIEMGDTTLSSHDPSRNMATPIHKSDVGQTKAQGPKRIPEQEPEGCFLPNDTVIKQHLSRSLQEIKIALSADMKQKLEKDADDRILATLIMLHILEVHFADMATETALVVLKAKMWLQQQGLEYDTLHPGLQNALTPPPKLDL